MPVFRCSIYSNYVQMPWKRSYLCNRSCQNLTYQTKSLPSALSHQEEHRACIRLLDLGQGHSLEGLRAVTSPWVHWRGLAHLEQASYLPKPLGMTLQWMVLCPGSGMHLKLKRMCYRETLITAACRYLTSTLAPCKAEKKDCICFYVLLMLLHVLCTWECSTDILQARVKYG